MRRAALAGYLLLCAAAAGAHPAPNSMLRFEFRADVVLAEYWVPVSELTWARAADPAGGFPVYLLRHVAAETKAGAAWKVSVESVRESSYLDHPYLVAELRLAPPAGVTAREFTLVDDVVTHEVRNHVVFVTARHGSGADLLGALQYPARRLRVAAP